MRNWKRGTADDADLRRNKGGGDIPVPRKIVILIEILQELPLAKIAKKRNGRRKTPLLLRFLRSFAAIPCANGAPPLHSSLFTLHSLLWSEATD